MWRNVKELQEYHLNEVHRIVKDAQLVRLEASLRRQFRDLHTMLLSIADEGCALTPAMRDEVISYGERLSSEVVTAVLQSSGTAAVHIDSRQVILTDRHHTQAKPLLWESYAKIRRVIPILGRNRVVVMGGFIGASEDGATTTMGRGGSDLTATLVGAGINADEVQVWKDVDGMLTCDPKVMPGGYRLKTISYAEAAALARSGAKLLHPETVTPVIRQRIPIVIRNSRRPTVEGTSIVPTAPSGTNPVKSISCKKDLTVLEVLSNNGREARATAHTLGTLCERHDVPVVFTGIDGNTVFLGVSNSARLESLAYSDDAGLTGLEARVHSNGALISLVGQGVGSTPILIARVLAVLQNLTVVCIPAAEADLTLRLLVPQREMKRSIELLHREFFQNVDPAVFVENSSHQAIPKTASAVSVNLAQTSGSQRPRLVLA